MKGTAVITGAAQASKKDQLQVVEQEIVALGRKSVCVMADVAVEDEVRSMVEAVVEKFGGIDVMVANAGICKGAAFLDLKVDDWDFTFSINVRGVFLCYQYAAKQMVAQGRGGRIIGACSLAGKQVRGLTQSAAHELGQHGITVNAYAPSVLESPMTEGFARLAGVDPKIIYDRQAAQTPVGRNGQLSDIAAVVSYLASKESSFITAKPRSNHFYQWGKIFRLNLSLVHP
ncbi:NAD-binding protein [Mycena sp. CBHHK59/15]|nr:NAD-binding protein [Mycena sp. CBHHK59/15]